MLLGGNGEVAEKHARKHPAELGLLRMGVVFENESSSSRTVAGVPSLRLPSSSFQCIRRGECPARYARNPMTSERRLRAIVA